MARIIGALKSAVRLYNATVDSYLAVLFTTDSRTLAGELLRLLYRAAACRVDPQFVSALVRRADEAYQVLKYLVPLMAPLVVRLFRYLQKPAFHMEPRHQRERYSDWGLDLPAS